MAMEIDGKVSDQPTSLRNTNSIKSVS